MVNKKEKYLVKIYKLCDLISIGYPKLVQIKDPVEQEELVLGYVIVYILHPYTQINLFLTQNLKLFQVL